MIRTMQKPDIGRVAGSAVAASREFLAWWAAELRALVPPRLRNLFLPPVPEITIKDMGETYAIALPGDDPQELGELDWESALPSAQANALGSLEAPAVTLVLDEARAISSEITMPRLGARDLGEALALRYETELPLNRESAYYSYRARTEEDGTQRVTIFACKRATVDGLVSHLSEQSLRPEKVVVGIEGDTVAVLSSVTGVGGVKRAAKRREIALALLPPLLLILSLLIYGYRLEISRARMDQQIVGLADEVRGLNVMALQIEEERVFREQLGDRAAAPSVLAAIAALTEALPDHAWVNDMRISAGAMRITGLADDPADLIAPLEGQAIFENVRLGTIIANRQSAGKERFLITLDMKDGVS